MSINNNLIQATETLINSSISRLHFDKTIKAKILRVIDINEGKYSISYQGGTLTVYSSNKKKFYKEGDEVYVKVPGGDLSNKKFIEDYSRNSDIDLTDESNTIIQNYTYPVSENFLDKFNGRYGLCAGEKDSEDPQKDQEIVIFPSSDIKNTVDNENFQWYAAHYTILELSAKFTTEFYSEHTSGVYGLRIEYITSEGNSKPFEYSFDSSKDFNGNPYKFLIPAPQLLQLDVKEKYLVGISSITFFQKDFIQDKKEESTISDSNIFVEDLSLRFLDKKDLTKIPYFLRIKAPKGHIMSAEEGAELFLEPELYGEGKILPIQKCIWFKRQDDVQDFTVTNKEAGKGWVQIGSSSDSYTINGNILKIPKDAFEFENQYKVVVVYKEKSFVAETSVQQKSNLYNIVINQRHAGKKTVLVLKGTKKDGDTKIEEDISSTLRGKWSILLKNGNENAFQQIQPANQVDSNQIEVTPYLNLGTTIFCCDIFKKNPDGSFIYLTTQRYSLQIESAQNTEKYSAYFSGEQFFRYDANGNIETEIFSMEHALEFHISLLNNDLSAVDKEARLKKLNIQWYLSNGNEEVQLNETVGPNFSLIKQYRVDTDAKILYYYIKEQYDKNKSPCKIIVRVTDPETEQIDEFVTSINFLQTGDQGTNGTGYSVKIEAVNSMDEKNPIILPYSFLKAPIKQGADNIYDTILLKASVEKKSSSYSDDLTISYDWSFPQEKDSNGELIKYLDFFLKDKETEEKIKTKKIVSIQCKKAPESDSNNLYYVKLKTTIKENGETSIIYNLYPIDIIVDNSDQIDKSKLELEIPKTIKYNSAGEKPQFNTLPLVFKYQEKDLSRDIIEYSNNKKLVKIFDIKNDKGEIIGKKLDPVGKFLADTLEIGLIKCPINSNNSYVLHPIIPYLDTFGNEDINGWDGTKFDFIGPEGEEHTILAPQIGAGEKNTSNQFTGIIMGKDAGQKKVGLYGYNNGVNTFSLDEKGVATFGASTTGQIKVDGISATISGVSSQTNPTGTMSLYLSGNAENNSNDYAIKINSNSTGDDKKDFYVRYDGTLHATGADIIGEITATGGEIGGWKITAPNETTVGSISIEGKNNVYLKSDGSIKLGDNFSVDNTGNVIVKGHIEMGANSFIDWTQVKDNGALDKATIADSNATIADQKVEDLANGSIEHIAGTFINGHLITSPTIFGGKIISEEYFAVAGAIDADNNPVKAHGYFGAAIGKDEKDQNTYGVAISIQPPEEIPPVDTIKVYSGKPYVIVTDAGARMTTANNHVIVTDSGITLSSTNKVKISGQLGAKFSSYLYLAYDFAYGYTLPQTGLQEGMLYFLLQ